MYFSWLFVGMGETQGVKYCAWQAWIAIMGHIYPQRRFRMCVGQRDGCKGLEKEYLEGDEMWTMEMWVCPAADTKSSLPRTPDLFA
jgi:hypothetical protein